MYPFEKSSMLILVNHSIALVCNLNTDLCCINNVHIMHNLCYSYPPTTNDNHNRHLIHGNLLILGRGHHKKSRSSPYHTNYMRRSPEVAGTFVQFVWYSGQVQRKCSQPRALPKIQLILFSASTEEDQLLLVFSSSFSR